MSKKHLTLNDRTIIQSGLQQHLTLAKLADYCDPQNSNQKSNSVAVTPWLLHLQLQEFQKSQLELDCCSKVLN